MLDNIGHFSCLQAYLMIRLFSYMNSIKRKYMRTPLSKEGEYYISILSKKEKYELVNKLLDHASAILNDSYSKAKKGKSNG